MNKSKKIFAFAIVVLLAIALVTTGCSNGGSTTQTTTTGTTTTTTTAAGGTTQPTTEPMPPTKISMFWSDAGVAFPSGVDKGNNPFINKVMEAANVDLEVISPAYGDYQTRFNLMMASGELTNVVHHWFHGDVNKYGSEGAFINWQDWLPQSDTLKEHYTDEMVDTLKASDGNVYYLIVLSASNPEGTYARMDLLDETNNGVIPVTPDEWYQAMKNLVAAYPDSVPLTGTGFMMMDMFWKAYGVAFDGNGVLMQQDSDFTKYMWGFEAPLARQAVEYHRKLYAEGLLDRTFVTNTGTEKSNRIYERNALIFRGNAGAVVGAQEGYLQAGNQKAVIGFVPNPIEPGVEPRLAYWRNAPMGWAAVSVSAQSSDEQIDASIRLIETFLNPEINEFMVWGREGIEYVTKPDGSRLLDVQASKNTAYRLAYNFMRSYHYQEQIDLRVATLLPQLAPAQAERFKEAWETGVPVRDAESAQVPTYTPANYVPSLTDLAPKYNEAREVSLTIVYKAVMGEITMEQYDQEVSSFLDTYGFITEAYTEKLLEVKAERGIQ